MKNVELNRLLRIKKMQRKKRPSFRRIESWRYKRVKGGWRAAKGIDSKTRQKLKSGVKSPNVGYRSPKKLRGLHPCGLIEKVVHNLNQINELDPTIHGLKISSKIGNKKRMGMIADAQLRNFKILNLGTSYFEDLKMRDLVFESKESEDEDSDEKGKKEK
jgi:large subunit ribosomal protein L32e